MMGRIFNLPLDAVGKDDRIHTQTTTARPIDPMPAFDWVWLGWSRWGG